MPDRSWLPAVKAGAAAAALAISAASFIVQPDSAATSGQWTVPGPGVPAGASANLTGLAMAGPSLGWAPNKSVFVLSWRSGHGVH
jgi:hypothetical protein